MLRNLYAFMHLMNWYNIPCIHSGDFGPLSFGNSIVEYSSKRDSLHFRCTVLKTHGRKPRSVKYTPALICRWYGEWMSESTCLMIWSVMWFRQHL